jgi:DNA-damage-inducible protein D
MDSQISQAQAGFEDIKRVENGVEYWSARELMPLLEYVSWQKFEHAIDRAKEAVTKSGQPVADHFIGAGNMIKTGKGAQRNVVDYQLTRYACYLIAQNGDSRKRAIALAQTYFATQTRRQELGEQQKKDIERLDARNKLRATERRFSGVVMDRGVDQKGIAEIRGAGDQALFGVANTVTMKKQLGIKPSKPLADYLPTVTLKAKDLAAEMTTVNTIKKDLYNTQPIKREHVDNNKAVRGVLAERGIRPEVLPPEEDVHKIESRIKKLGT